MRSFIARALVRWVSGWIGTAYYANVRRWRGVERAASKVGLVAQHIAFPLARRLDYEAHVTQLVDECWWG